jgi:hypothetical protein
MNYYDSKKNSKDIRVWFEFIAKEKEQAPSAKPKKDLRWKEIPKQYLDLISRLLSAMVCCKDADDVPDSFSSDFCGIKIRTLRKCPDTASCSICCDGKKCTNITQDKDFDFTPMSKVKSILQEYYKRFS